MKNHLRAAVLLLTTCYAIGSFGQATNNQRQYHYTKKGGWESPDTKPSSSTYNDPFTDLFFKVFMCVGAYSLVGSYSNEDHLHNELTPYPYFDSRSGNYTGDDASAYLLKPFRFDIDERILIGGSETFGNHLNFQFRPFQYAYLQADYVQLFDSNNSEYQRKDHSVFYLNLCYDRLRFSRFNLGWTIGASYVGNEMRRWGFCFGLNAAAFFSKNISLYSSMKWSRVSNRPVNEFETKVRYHHKKFFYSLGYENLKVATPRYDLLSVGAGVYL